MFFRQLPFFNYRRFFSIFQPNNSNLRLNYLVKFLYMPWFFFFSQILFSISDTYSIIFLFGNEGLIVLRLVFRLLLFESRFVILFDLVIHCTINIHKESWNYLFHTIPSRPSYSMSFWNCYKFMKKKNVTALMDPEIGIDAFHWKPIHMFSFI